MMNKKITFILQLNLFLTKNLISMINLMKKEIKFHNTLNLKIKLPNQISNQITQNIMIMMNRFLIHIIFKINWNQVIHSVLNV